jgi:hypothetical protein
MPVGEERDCDESIPRETAPKSSDDGSAEEILAKVERHGIARYSKDRCLPVIKSVLNPLCTFVTFVVKNELRWYRGANASSSSGRGIFILSWRTYEKKTGHRSRPGGDAGWAPRAVGTNS